MIQFTDAELLYLVSSLMSVGRPEEYHHRKSQPKCRAGLCWPNCNTVHRHGQLGHYQAVPMVWSDGVPS